MRQTCLRLDKNPIKRARPNEVGNDIEPFVLESLEQEGLTAHRPAAKSGKGKSTGYPDLKIDTDFGSVYLVPPEKPFNSLIKRLLRGWLGGYIDGQMGINGQKLVKG